MCTYECVYLHAHTCVGQRPCWVSSQSLPAYLLRQGLTGPSAKATGTCDHELLFNVGTRDLNSVRTLEKGTLYQLSHLFSSCLLFSSRLAWTSWQSYLSLPSSGMTGMHHYSCQNHNLLFLKLPAVAHLHMVLLVASSLLGPLSNQAHPSSNTG